jgi:hypothetical protein
MFSSNNNPWSDGTSFSSESGGAKDGPITNIDMPSDSRTGRPVSSNILPTPRFVYGKSVTASDTASINGLRHGINAATKSQSMANQTQREIWHLYQLQGAVLQQNQYLFRDTVDTHLEESQAQQQIWITHNKELIIHSTKNLEAQTLLRIQQIQKFFPPQRMIISSIQQPRTIVSCRYHIARLAQHFPLPTSTQSKVWLQQAKEKAKQYNTPKIPTSLGSNWPCPIGARLSAELSIIIYSQTS